jgi:hypothetical protein
METPEIFEFKVKSDLLGGIDPLIFAKDSYSLSGSERLERSPSPVGSADNWMLQQSANWFNPDPLLTHQSPLFPSSSSQLTSFSAHINIDPILGISPDQPLVGGNPDFNQPLVGSNPDFSIKTSGTFTMNGSGDLDGNPLDSTDDALVYAAFGFTINGNPTLPVQRDAKGNIIKDSSGKPILVDNAITVAPGYTVSNGPSNKYAGLNPPTVIANETFEIPAYNTIKTDTLASRIPTGTPETIFDASRNPLNNLKDWQTKFPNTGTPTQPRVIRVINGSLNVPHDADLSNTIIIVERGDINFNGSNHDFTNSVLIANSGNINLDKVNANNLAILASGSININGGANFSGNQNLIATGNGNVTFNGSTKTTNSSDQVQVIAKGNITYNGSSSTRGSFESTGTFTYNGSSYLYGSIEALGNITFNGNATVIGASIGNTLNQAPTNLLLNPNTIAENVFINTVVGSFTTVDPNSNDSHSYQLVTGLGDTDNNTFQIVNNQLQIKLSPDFEAKNNYSIRVRTTDQGGLSLEKNLLVQITNINEAPTNLTLSPNIVEENRPIGTVVGTFNATDPDLGDLASYTLVSGTGDTDNAAFQIVGNQLRLNLTPDFETKDGYSIRVRTTDQGGLSLEKNLFVQITNINEAPIDIALSQSTIAENTPITTAIAKLSTLDPDLGDSHTYQLVAGTGNLDNAAFTIAGDRLYLRQAADFETQNSYSIRVRSTDLGGLFSEKILTIGVSDVNEAPTSVRLSQNTVVENSPIGTVVGTLTSQDPDIGDRHTYSLISGTGDSDNSAFEIAGDKLQLKVSPDFETQSSYKIRVRTTDLGGLSLEKELTVAVTDVPDLTLRENSNFNTAHTLNLEIPQTPSLLSFKIDALNFDVTDKNRINDAFEVALVDARGKSLVHTIGTNRDAFFNLTEGENAALAAGVTYSNGTITLNLTGLTATPDARLIFRLVNDDSDTATTVRITNLAVTAAPAGTQPVISTIAPQDNTPRSTTTPNWLQLTDVSTSIAPEYGKTSFNLDSRLLYVDAKLKNLGSYGTDGTLYAVINHLSDPTVRVRTPDGFTPEGLPYFRFNSADGKLDPNESSDLRTLVFYNPNQVQFTYDLEVRASVNVAPVITTETITEARVGRSYTYDLDATDANRDTLTYKLLAAPSGLKIDAETGIVTWTPLVSDLGNHSLILEVADGRGGVDRQEYLLNVLESIPNRPPLFTSTPIVSANINRPYRYRATATDLDGDELLYSLVSAPLGMQVDSETGLVSWTPTGSQLGTYDVRLNVADGLGGVAQQKFQVQTLMEVGNTQPQIISQPITQFGLLPSGGGSSTTINATIRDFIPSCLHM